MKYIGMPMDMWVLFVKSYTAWMKPKSKLVCGE